MRAILFDVDGVLIHGFNARPETRRRWDEHLHADLGINPDVFRDTFIKGPFEADVLTGRTSLLSALETALPVCGYAGSPLNVVSY